MDYKSLKTLEYHKIIEKLSSYAGSEAARKMCADLKPMEHMPQEHQRYLAYNAEDFKTWAMSVGPMTEKAVYHFLELLILLTALSVLRSEAR